MSQEFRVEKRGTCIIFYGAVPVSALAEAQSSLAPGAILDLHLARLLGATFAAGPAEELMTLRKSEEVLEAARERSKAYLATFPNAWLPEGASEWHATGQRGMSSDAIFQKLTGTGDKKNAPRDPDDLRRCRLLLDQVPAFGARLHEMKNVSPAWAALIKNWDNLCAVMDSERPNWRESEAYSYPMTYEMMSVLEERHGD